MTKGQYIKLNNLEAEKYQNELCDCGHKRNCHGAHGKIWHWLYDTSNDNDMVGEGECRPEGMKGKCRCKSFSTLTGFIKQVRKDNL